MKKFKIMSLLLLCICLQLQAQPYGSYEPAKRMHIIIDNDFSGDVDGLFQLAHHLMCPSVDIRGIIGSHLTAWPGSNEDDPAVMNSTPRAVAKAREVVKLMGIDVPVVAGAENQLTAFNEPQPSEGARLIIREAMRTDTDVPLYVVCGASLTDVASAWLMEPEIEKRITVVWIGGREYDGMKLPAPDTDLLEFNHQLSMKSVELVFNRSQIPLWQVPRDAYRQCIMSLDEVETDIRPCGRIGQYLADQLSASLWSAMGEVYIMGDSPLVLLTALQTGFHPDPSSSQYVLRPAPTILPDGRYQDNPQGRLIRVYTHLDTRLMFADLKGKLKRFK